MQGRDREGQGGLKCCLALFFKKPARRDTAPAPSKTRGAPRSVLFRCKYTFCRTNRGSKSGTKLYEVVTKALKKILKIFKKECRFNDR